MKEPPQTERQREALLQQIQHLAGQALFGTLSETYRTCGNPGCRCHRQGPKHGPHLYVSYRGGKGKTTGYYVPKAIQPQVRENIAAWHQLQACLQQLAALNKERLLKSGRSKTSTFATGSS
jgi:hypothetical protein